MKEDEKDGWWSAPAAKYWRCPECKKASPVADWKEVEPPCEDCGSHDGRECPHCGEWLDHVYDDGKIEAAAEADPYIAPI